jgi:hypothetical protein
MCIRTHTRIYIYTYNMHYHINLRYQSTMSRPFPLHIFIYEFPLHIYSYMNSRYGDSRYIYINSLVFLCVQHINTRYQSTMSRSFPLHIFIYQFPLHMYSYMNSRYGDSRYIYSYMNKISVNNEQAFPLHVFIYVCVYIYIHTSTNY